MKHSLLAAAALLILPLAALAELTAHRLWENRLMLPDYRDEGARHEPRYTDGTYLPPYLTGTRRYTAADSPLFITTPTVIDQDAAVLIGEGVLVVVHEYAGLENYGRLTLQGTAANPIVFTTNEVHPDNQTWNGVLTQPGGHTAATHLWVQYASPALTCQPGSAVHIENTRLEHGTVGLVAASDTCTLENSHITNVRDGVVAINATPQVTNTTIRARDHDIQSILP